MADKGSLSDTLLQGKYYIILVFALVIMITIGTYFYLDSKGLANRLGQKEADYGALNDTYNALSSEHSALVISNNDMVKRYTDVNGRYNNLSVDNQYLKSAYDGLNGTVNRFQETGGVVIALYTNFYQTGTSSNSKKVAEITAYNVGNKKADRVTIKCRVIDNGSTSVSEQTFTNVDPIDKRRSRWEYSNTTQLEAVWVEL
jgi:hypothetical protein